MYRKGFVLVHPERLAARDSAGVMRYTPISLPAGKVPLVLSIDDLSYYEYMTGDGFASRLVALPDGRVVNDYTDAQGVSHRGSYDLVPLVDDFVRGHPDFSYRGDKGSIALTGYNGVLGYRSSVRAYGDTPATRVARRRAKVVAEAIKRNGWALASHSWGHINMTTSSLEAIKADARRWDTEVRPIVGNTREFVYPFGADISGGRAYESSNPKYRFLHQVEKFDYFFGVDASTTHWMQLGAGSLRQARIDVDGIRMHGALTGHGRVLSAFFDVASTLDPARKAAPG
jgi:hypothetical protein